MQWNAKKLYLHTLLLVAIFPSQDVTAELIHHYIFENGVVEDQALVSPINGIIHGAIVANGIATFNGTSDYIEFPNSGQELMLPVGSGNGQQANWTITFFARQTTFQFETVKLLSQGTQSTDDVFFGHSQLRYINVADRMPRPGIRMPVHTIFNHYAVTVQDDGETAEMVLYINGRYSDFEIAASFSGNPLTDVMRLGRGSGSLEQYFHGEIADLRIYDEILDTAAIARIIDPDQDGLSLEQEVVAGTQPHNPDSDGDGLLDGFEVEFGFNPLLKGDEVLDLDRDGTLNLAEQTAGTDPHNPDSDDDGFNDGFELQFQSDPADTQQTPLQRLLFASDPQRTARFGKSVVVSGNVAAIGAPSDYLTSTLFGAVYIFKNVGDKWVEHQKLTPSQDTSDFGFSIAMTGNHLIVGSPEPHNSNTPGSGKVFVFTRQNETWVEQAVISASDGELHDRFGSSVDIQGNFIVVGAEGDDEQGNESGSTYIFEKVAGSWLEQQKLIPAVGNADSGFGADVEISGDNIIIGAAGDNELGPESGAAFIFSYDGVNWLQDVKLTGSDESAGDLFGGAVSILGNRALVGATGEDSIEQESGAAYLFQKSGNSWHQISKFKNHVIRQSAAFGTDVSLDTSMLAVSSYVPISSRHGIGLVDVFVHAGNAWEFQQTFQHRGSSTTDGAGFGQSIHLSQSNLIVGRPLHDFPINLAGSAYIFPVIVGGEEDLDDDSLSNVLEHLAGTDSLSPDSDFDGMSDRFELENRFNPLLGTDGPQDPDSDSLTNAEEDMAGTNPYSADTDFDGYPDGLEVALGSDPDNNLVDPIDKVVYPSDGQRRDFFGTSVAIRENILAVGSPTNDEAEGDAGAVYIFEFAAGKWNFKQKLLASDPAISARFGQSVAFGENKLVVGARDDPENGIQAGAVYVFSVNDGVWSEDQKITPDDGSIGDFFGASIAISNETILVGAYRDNTRGSRDGSAYVFTNINDNWVQQAKLNASDGTTSDNFGFSVALEGNTAVIGSPFDDDNASGSGSVYIFTRSNNLWTEVQKIYAIQPQLHASFGNEVAIKDAIIVVGAKDQDGTSNNMGGLYVFRKAGNVWGSAQELFAADPVSVFRLGTSISFDGNTIVAGSTSRAVYTFKLDNNGVWSREKILEANSLLGGSLFYGESVAISGNQVVAGAIGYSKFGEYSGAVISHNIVEDPFQDSDDDGLINILEEQLGTDYENKDTDQDGLFDGFEHRYGFNPLQFGEHLDDPDFDDLNNLAEQNAGTNPNNDDTDGDGTSDGDELSNGTDPLSADFILQIPMLATFWLFAFGLLVVWKATPLLAERQ